MSLLDQDIKKQEPKGKKIVLALLILSVILLIFLIVAMVALKENKVNELTLSIDEKNVAIENGLLISDEDGVYYISIQKISKLIGYEYLTGEYKKYNEDNTNTKAYIENENQIIQFEANNDIVYKIDLTANLDYEEYKLDNRILKENNLLYIALDDLNIGLNVVYKYLQNDNKITLNTVENLAQGYIKTLAKDTNNTYISISNNYNNNKAIAYDMLVVSNESQKWGVIKASDFSTIIGNKYSSIQFIESAGVFIVCDDNRYGVISTKQNEKPVLELQFEQVLIACNKPLCYKAKIKGEYALINEEGNLIINDTFNSFGYASRNVEEESVLIINNIGKETNTAIVVVKNNKYGLVDLDNGRVISKCILDRIYAKNENGEKKYYVQLQGQEMSLENYIEQINTTTVNIGG